MKKLNVTVNGITFEVEVELIEEGDTQEVSTFPVPNTSVYQSPAPLAPAPAPIPNLNYSKPQPVGTKGLDDSALYSPMNGKIMDVKVRIGENIRTGQVVIELEAMKMKTNIYASRDGIVKSIFVTTGSLVESGQKLIEFE